MENNWHRVKSELITILTDTADEIDSISKSSSISRIIGNTTSTVGNVMFLTGVMTMPVTAGLSASLLVSGLSLGFLGTSVSAGSSLAESILRKRGLERMNEQIENFHRETELLLSKESSYFWNFRYGASILLSGTCATTAIFKFTQFLDGMNNHINFFKTIGCSTKLASKLAIGFDITGLLVDSIDTIDAGKNLIIGKRPSANLRKLIEKFKSLTIDDLESQFSKFRGCISITNNGVFVARFVITYYDVYSDANQLITIKSGNMLCTQTVTKDIPIEAKDINLKIQILKFGYWSTIEYDSSLSIPCYRQYELYGSCFSPKTKYDEFML